MACYQTTERSFSTTSKEERLDEYLGIASVPDLTPEEVKLIEDTGAKHFHQQYVSYSVRVNMNFVLTKYLPGVCISPIEILELVRTKNAVILPVVRSVDWMV